MDIVENISETVNSSLEGVYSNKTTSAIIGLFLVLYAGLAAPKLPKSVAKMFGNPAFRLAILFLVAYMSSRNTSIAIIATVALVISMQTLSYHEANEKLQKKIEEEVEMETQNEMVGEESELNTEEEITSYNANGDFAQYGEEEHHGLLNGEEHSFGEEEHSFGEEHKFGEEEIVGNHQEELYAPVNEEELASNMQEFALTFDLTYSTTSGNCFVTFSSLLVNKLMLSLSL